MTQFTAPARMPIYVLAGVLGSGKTTLMARLARYCIAEQIRVGMVVNDIGDLGVDALVLAETGWPHAAVDSLSGECACCSDSTDLEEVLTGMRELKRELLLFETTGIADSADMLNTLTAHDLQQLIDLPRLITVLDLTRYPSALAADPIVRRQIDLADAIVLSKADLVDAAVPDAAVDAIRALNPTVPILRQELQDSDLAALLRIGVQHEAALDAVLVAGLPIHAIPHTLTITLPNKLDRQRFEAFLLDLPAPVLRAKGFVALNEQPSLHTFQYVEPGFTHLSPFQVARRPGVVMASGRPDSPYGIFIGTALDEAALRAGLEACVSPEAMSS